MLIVGERSAVDPKGCRHEGGNRKLSLPDRHPIWDGGAQRTLGERVR
ncbi:hypothetical protein HNR37_001175 [Desulfurispira natronophila]|uniref:Uncharacterized protein n=1 Tax=Desulfurispira natronophila TaxID=682562 RepID=A0A7W7Y4B9_9BACT|nr:hypothetical protein [Desulfurispira natronophila]